MKKFVAVLLVLIFVFTLAGCSQSDSADPAFALLKGPTAFGALNLLENRDGLNYTVYGSADEITPLLIKGELDIAAVPANLASVIYNKSGGDIELLAINTLGVLYIAETENSISCVGDLSGKTLYATGKGSAPEYALRHVLSSNGLDAERDVEIIWKSEPAEILSILKQNGGIAMLPQPYMTVALTQIPELTTALDITSEWQKTNSGECITGVLVARKVFVKENPRFVKEFLEDYKKSCDTAVSDVAGTASLSEKYDIVSEAVAKKALPLSNIKFIDGEDMKTAMSGYLKVLFSYNPASVGGKLPNDDFYYEKK